RLTADQIGQVRRWIAAGAPWPDEQKIKTLLESEWSQERNRDGRLIRTSGGLSDDWTFRRYKPEDLWAYQPLTRPAAPGGTDTHPIDAFVDRKLAEAGLIPAPPADRRALVRRATYDLTGLPPTSKQISTFTADRSPDAWADLVDRLLASPRYGERMAQHWLDVARYADSSGFSNDHARPHAWRYRDYVIRAFNSDKPYDQFVREQVAGDEINPDDAEHRIAVGFLRTGPWEHTSMSVAAVTRQQFLDDVTNNVGEVFLGQALRCASCHDHKFDPIPTRDYYRMQAIFAPIKFAEPKAPFLSTENTRGMAAHDARMAKLKQAKAIRSLETIPQSQWPVASYDEDSETKGHKKVSGKRKQWLDREIQRSHPLAFSLRSDSAESTHILTGGSIESPGPQVAPGVLSAVAALAGTNESTTAVTRERVGRRKALAAWIASPDNPLTARVIVNRVWQWHFGRGLAANPNNFGKTGTRPTHPQLLDWLAVRFIEDGWSIKKLRKLIMTSKTYRRAALAPRPDSAEAQDSENRLLARFSPRRLSAEELRDSMLQVSGELNVEMGGLPIRPHINLEVAMQPRHIMGSVGPAYQPSLTPAQRNRRTIYTERIRTLGDPMLEVFNRPGFDTSCERRDASTVTPQVFTLFNSINSYDRALAFARRVEESAREPAARVDLAFRLALGRLPTGEQRRKALAHVDRMTGHHSQSPRVATEPPRYVIREMVEEMTGLSFYWVEDLDVYANPGYVADTKPWDVPPRTRALADLCLVLFNTNEFIYVY
ncbi:MAG: DUF1549 and DUF1553 domain-containing protein, partial [Phycisphaerae bacterium]|nr:DUF1549 and DUF1553 domain-containing protein [Phycisphaerae bacterium]